MIASELIYSRDLRGEVFSIENMLGVLLCPPRENTELAGAEELFPEPVC